MKNIFNILTEYGVEIPEDKKKDFEKAVLENYKTVAEVTNVRSKLETLQKQYDDEIKKRDDDLTSLQEQLKNADVDAAKVKDLNDKIAQMQEENEKATKSYEQQLESQRYEFAIKERANDLKFSSGSAKKSFIADAIAKGMKLDGDNVLGFDDFVESYKKDDAAAFVENEEENTKPHFTAPTGIQTGEDITKPSIPAVW